MLAALVGCPGGLQLLKQSTKISSQCRPFCFQLPPCNPYDGPSRGLKFPISLPIGLEGGSGSVRLAPIQLDDQPLLAPEAIDLDDAAIELDKDVGYGVR